MQVHLWIGNCDVFLWITDCATSEFGTNTSLPS